MGESLLVQTHPLGFTGDTNPFNPLSVCIEIHHASTWHGPLVTHTCKVTPKAAAGGGEGMAIQQQLPYRASALSLTQIHSSVFLSWPWAPSFRNSVSKKHHKPCRWFVLYHSSYSWQILRLHINTPQASSLKLSQTHSPKSLRSKTLYGLATQKFLLDLRVGRSWCFKQERLMAPCLWTSRHLPICRGNQASTKVLGSSELL